MDIKNELQSHFPVKQCTQSTPEPRNKEKRIIQLGPQSLQHLDAIDRNIFELLLHQCECEKNK